MEDLGKYGKDRVAGILKLDDDDIQYNCDVVNHSIDLRFRNIEALDKLIVSAENLKRAMLDCE